MADAKIVDIKGVQWELKDEVARSEIATMKQLLEIETISDVPIILKNGYTATMASIQNIQKYGRLYKGLLYIDNLNGSVVGTTSSGYIGDINRNVLGGNFALGLEYLTGSVIRILIANGGIIQLTESLGVNKGSNRIRTPIIWFE